MKLSFVWFTLCFMLPINLLFVTIPLIALFSLASSLVVDGYSEYMSAVGSSIAIPCNTSIWGEDLISLVLWYKENSGSGLPIYSVDARNTPLSQSRHSVPDSYRERLYFDVKVKPPVLRISPVLEGDAGDYRCRVDYRKSRTKNFVTKLGVIVPPREMIITDPEGQRLTATIGPYDEASDLILICEAEGGNPLPKVTWWTADTLIDDSYGPAPHSNMRNQLLIGNLNRSHFLLELTCKASNTNLTAPLESSVILDMNLKPLEVKITSQVGPLYVGKRTELQCLSSGSRPSAKITWWKGSEKLTNVRDTSSSDGNVTLSTVSFVPMVDDNGKYFSCRAESPSIKNTGLEDGRVLNVHFVPQLSISLGAKIQHDLIREGNDVYLECNVVANPWISGVTWFFGEEQLMSNPSHGVIVSNQSLVLQKVRRTQSGRYFCTASNSAGQGQSSDFYLRIKFAPVCKPGQKIIYGVARNEIVHISCEVQAEPPNVQFKWSLNASNENAEVPSFVINETTSVAKYRPKNRFAYGALACWAVNEIGVQRDPCMFNIIPTGPPEAVRKCSIGNQSTTSLYVECTAGDNGALRQEFTVEVYNALRQSLHANYSSSTRPAFHIHDLPTGTPFTLVLYASNAKGRSHSISLSASTLGEPEKHTGAVPQFGLNPMFSILIGTVGALVLIAIIVVIVIRIKSDYCDDDGTNGKGFEFGRETFDRPTICLEQEHHQANECHQLCNQTCPQSRFYCQLASIGYNPNPPEMTYSDLQMSTGNALTGRMIIESIQEGITPIDYSSMSYQAFMEKNCDVDASKLAKRGFQIVDGSSDVEVSMEAPLMNSIIPSYQKIDQQRKPVVVMSNNEEDKSGPVYV